MDSKKNKRKKQRRSSRNIESLGISTEKKRIHNRKIQELNKMIDDQIIVTLKALKKLNILQKLENKQLDL